jgi:multidrug efflux system membrane fusion protein
MLWPGQFINASLLLGIEDNVVALTALAVQHGPNGLFVYQIKTDGTVSVRPIQVERKEGDTYVISNGLSEGAAVVTNGQSRLQEGAHVIVQDPLVISPKIGS